MYNGADLGIFDKAGPNFTPYVEKANDFYPRCFCKCRARLLRKQSRPLEGSQTKNADLNKSGI